MTDDELVFGADVIISIKATYEVRDKSGLILLEKTKGELVLTEKEFVFVEVRGTFRKEKKRLHAYSADKLVGYSYERWDGGDTYLYLTIENEGGDRQTFLYCTSKSDYEKFIGKVKERKLI
ncbi:MAG: hypothetical protein ACFFDJ_08845 [Candidatus Odinarchaeota archaeon]